MDTEKTHIAEKVSSEKFEILEDIGKKNIGAFGTVHKARVLANNLASKYGTNIVALKIPLGEENEQILKDEIILNGSLQKKLKKLNNINLVRFLDFEIFQGQYVMVMEYIGG
ncbi:MAG: hypothetical protein V2A61_00200, partial [Calditrichota bacterium]